MSEIYNINFPNSKIKVKNLIASLNMKEGISIKYLGNFRFEFHYTGGYNNVYDHTCIVEILDLHKNNHDKWFWWNINVTSRENETLICVDNLGYSLGFLDFFIDEYIKDVGTIINYDDSYESSYDD